MGHRFANPIRLCDGNLGHPGLIPWKHVECAVQGTNHPASRWVLAAEVPGRTLLGMPFGGRRCPLAYLLLRAWHEGWPLADLARRIGGRGWQSGRGFPRLWHGKVAK